MTRLHVVHLNSCGCARHPNTEKDEKASQGLSVGHDVGGLCLSRECAGVRVRCLEMRKGPGLENKVKRMEWE